MTYDKKSYQKQYYQLNKERIDASNRAWASAHPDKVKASAKKFRDAHIEEERRRSIVKNRKCKYGLTEEQFEAMWNEQGGLCAACGDPLVTGDVDHNHETGEVRGILCHGCNTALGFAKDSASRLRALAYYVGAA